MRRLTLSLESSRDAISHLTAALAQSRANEIRLRKELGDVRSHMRTLVATLAERGVALPPELVEVYRGAVPPSSSES